MERLLRQPDERPREMVVSRWESVDPMTGILGLTCDRGMNVKLIFFQVAQPYRGLALHCGSVHLDFQRQTR